MFGRSMFVGFLCLVMTPMPSWAQQRSDTPPWLRLINDECESESEPPQTLLLWNSDAEAEGGPPGFDDPLASDRPDFTEASCTVGRGVVQVEMGYTYFFDNDSATQLRTHSFPETLVRVGVLTEWLELRAAYNYGNEQQNIGGARQAVSGSEDLYLGLKLGLTPQQGIFPEMALMPQMTIPTGSAAFTADRTLPGVNWLYGWDINEFLSTAGSTQCNLAIDVGSADEYVEFAQSWTVGYTLTERLGAYTEWFVLSPAAAENVPTEHYFDGGFTFRVTNNLQLDIRGGKGLSDNSMDYFTGAGAVVRF